MSWPFLPAYVGPGSGFAFLGSFLSLLAALAFGFASLVLWPVRVLWAWVTRRQGYRNARVKRLIIVGLDGLDAALTERFLAEGKLPALARLQAQGGYRRLRTTFPALSPVAWSTFATGVNPARHNIFDFLNRSLKTYLPELSSARVRKPRRFWTLGRLRIPLARGSAELRRRSRPFWKILGDHHIHCTVLRVPVTFPPEKFNGKLLSAMCTPDLKGTQGSFSQFTTRIESATFEGGARYPLHRAGGRLEGWLEGPDDVFVAKHPPLRIRFRVLPQADGESATLEIQGHSLRLRRGEYSPWVRLAFRTALGLKIRGLARFLVTETGPECSVYVTPVQIDPEKPALPISHPSYYAMYLAKLLGPFCTLGMAEDTWALNEGAIGEQAFLDQVYLTQAEREAMFFAALEHTRRGVVACVFDATDRVQHMFFRRLDDAQSEHRDAIENIYRHMDGLIERAMRYIDRETALIVLSDHGFCPFRRGVNLNSWLYRNGYLALRDGACESGPYFQGVDWSRTRAYALGLSGLYLNLKGREAGGVVEPGAEADSLARELVGKLSNLADIERGGVAIRRVYAARTVYRGPYLDAAPDLIVGYNSGYRTAWNAAVGKITANVIEDNLKAWSGDHCVDPPLVPGVIFANRPIHAEDPGIEDLAPTALALFGVDRPKWMEGKPLLSLVEAAG